MGNFNASMARATFLAWLRENHADLYARAMRDATAPQLSGFLDSLTDTFKKITDSVPKLAETYVNTRAQIDAIKLNIERAKAGMYPIDPKTGQPYSSGQPAQVEMAIARESGMNPMLLLGGAVILFLLLRR
jgi:hypothetical protein